MAINFNGPKERVCWIDFDRAQTYSLNGSLPGRAPEFFESEPLQFDWWASVGTMTADRKQTEQGKEEWGMWLREMGFYNNS